MYKRKSYEPRECVICGAVYIPRRSNQKVCGDPECKRALTSIRNKEWQHNNHIKPKEPEPQAKKEDTIIAIGYAERQIEKTLSMVPKIDTEL